MPFRRREDGYAQPTDMRVEGVTGHPAVVDSRDPCTGIGGEFWAYAFQDDHVTLSGSTNTVTADAEPVPPHPADSMQRFGPIKCAVSLRVSAPLLSTQASARSRLPSATRSAWACEGNTHSSTRTASVGASRMG